MQILKYAIQNVAHELRQDGDLHAQAARRRQRQRHARAPVAAEGRQGTVRRRQVRRPVGHWRSTTSAASSSTRKALNAFTNAEHQQLQAPGAGLRSAGDAGVLGAQSLGVDPHSVGPEPEGAPHRGALPGFDRQSVPGLRRDDDGRPRRHPEQDPSRASRRTRICTTCEPEEAKHIPDGVPLARTWRSKRSTRIASFLKAGGVFTDDVIDAYIGAEDAGSHARCA